MGALQEWSEALAGVAARAGAAVVGVRSHGSVGSGMVVAAGRVLTNAHNARGQGALVTFADGRTAEASVVGTDLDADLAVLAVDTASVPPVSWGDGAAVRLGGAVFALANPGGLGLRVTAGFVSATGQTFRGPRGRRVTGTIEHTAPLPRGASGGPLTDAEGNLLGINTNRLGEGFYLAVPATEELRRKVDALARGESVSRPRLGVGIAPPWMARQLRAAVGLPEQDGLLVREVEEGSPAARAGLRRGDLIVAAGGRDVRDVDALYDALDALEPGASLALTVLRGAEELDVTVPFDRGGAREEGSV